MKRIYKSILGFLCFASVILAGAEGLDGSCDLLWTLSWIAVALFSAFGYKKLETAR
jgi:hypothetical protein